MKRIQLGNTAFEGQNDVYLIDGDRTVLVDVGVAVREVREQLRGGLADYGLSFADIDEILLTHWHHDHAGLAGEIQAESDATVRVHEADAGLVSGDEDVVSAHDDLLRSSLDDWNLPDDARAELLDFLDFHEDLAGENVDVTPFDDGDTFDVNGRTIEAVHLPGHAAGLSAYVFDGDGSDDDDADSGREAFVGDNREGEALAGQPRKECFCGDAVLPKYTPNVGGADLRVDSPLSEYVDSLLRFIDLNLARAWPGHRDVIGDPSGRAATILDHHRERTENVVGVLRKHGPCDTWTVSAHLFGDLESIHILHGPGEAYAHLDHLARHGVVERDGLEYELVDGDVDIGNLFPTVAVE